MRLFKVVKIEGKNDTRSDSNIEDNGIGTISADKPSNKSKPLSSDQCNGVL